MTKTAKEYADCPYCLEEIRKGALKCKHCQSIQPTKHPVHDGTCPYCLEEVKPGAAICRHCKSRLDEKVSCNCDSTKNHLEQMIFAPSFPSGPASGSPGFIGGQRCITMNVPICRWVEDIDPIAGFTNGRWECNWELRTICTPTWW